ncbi:hypothetical protein NMG60_11028105 [Bertholletia excelsa]
MPNRHAHSSPIPSCFRPSSAASGDHHYQVAAAPVSGHPNLTTCVYRTHLALFALTWSRTVFGRSLDLHILFDDGNNNPTLSPCVSSSPTFHLHIKPFIFWKKHGSKKLCIDSPTSKTIQVFWDLSRAKFGSRPEPQSGYYIAVVADGEMALLAGDSSDEAYAKTRAAKPSRPQLMVLRREHVYGNKLYNTKANFGGQTRNLTIDCRVGEDPRLYFSVDGKRVLQVKHLKWKFRGNERIEVDGIYVQVSWDVYNWLFEDDEDGYALFMFKFEKLGFDEEEDYLNQFNEKNNNGMVLWAQQSCGFGFEKKKMKKSHLRTARSTSSSSLSSASSGCSSVMEWASVEETELKGPSEFSLLVYAWKS